MLIFWVGQSKCVIICDQSNLVANEDRLPFSETYEIPATMIGYNLVRQLYQVKKIFWNTIISHSIPKIWEL